MPISMPTSTAFCATRRQVWPERPGPPRGAASPWSATAAFPMRARWTSATTSSSPGTGTMRLRARLANPIGC